MFICEGWKSIAYVFDPKMGITKWVINIYDASSMDVLEKYDALDQAGQTVGIATILTLVKKKNQD